MAPETTCQSCRHWHALPRPQVQTAAGSATDLTAPQVGECREQPHALMIPTPQGGTAPVALYLQLPVNFPACGRWEG